MKLKQYPHALKCLACYYKARSRFAKKNSSQVRVSGTSSRLPVLSLTSIKPRLKTLHLAIHHVLSGGPELSAVEIWLDHSLRGEITPELRWLESNGCTLNFVEDIGPHTKLIYCLQKHPEAAVITIDDDILLPEHSLDVLLEAAKFHPDTVICNRARKIQLDQHGRAMTYSAWRVMPHASLEPEMGIMPLGYGGILYPKYSLHPSFADGSQFKKLCPTGDDLWFMAMRLINRKNAYNTGHLRGGEIAIPGSGKHCIKNRHQHVRGNNDESITRLFDTLDLSRHIAVSSTESV